MNCRFCGTALVPDALFCGECGRSVAQVEIVIEPRRRPQAPRPAARDTAILDDLGGPAAAVPPAPQLEHTRGEGPGARGPVTSESVAEGPGAEVAVPGVPVPEQPRAAAATGEQFVLQFSTGESVVVVGSGLVGRHPSAEPGEYLDHLVSVFDVGKSVSKSHVEFGQESGRFWVSDRFSTNGTLVRAPGADPVRCEPGRRQFIERGTRVEIGDQFFVVS